MFFDPHWGDVNNVNNIKRHFPKNRFKTLAMLIMS